MDKATPEVKADPKETEPRLLRDKLADCKNLVNLMSLPDWLNHGDFPDNEITGHRQLRYETCKGSQIAQKVKERRRKRMLCCNGGDRGYTPQSERMPTSVMVIYRKNKQEHYEHQRVNYFAKQFAQGDADEPC